jgi:hypothetical protein
VEIAQKAQVGNMRYIRALVWASLQKHHPDIGIDDVADLIIQAGGMEHVIEVMGQLSESAQPDPQDVKVSGAKPRKRPRTAQADVGGIGAISTSRRGGSA